MRHVRGGLLTDHAAGLVVPAWMYVAFRGLHSVLGRRSLLQRTLGRNPELAALSLFVASTLTEIGQFSRPRDIDAVASAPTASYIHGVGRGP